MVSNGPPKSCAAPWPEVVVDLRIPALGAASVLATRETNEDLGCIRDKAKSKLSQIPLRMAETKIATRNRRTCAPFFIWVCSLSLFGRMANHSILFLPMNTHRKIIPFSNHSVDGLVWLLRVFWAYFTVTFTTVEMVAAPEVPVTVNVVGPAGVPCVTGVFELEPTAPQPAIASARAKVARHAHGTRRH